MGSCKIIELKGKSHQHKVECKFCKRVFVAGAFYIREHFKHINLACGAFKCTVDESVLQPVLDEMRTIDVQSKAAVAAQTAQTSMELRSLGLCVLCNERR